MNVRFAGRRSGVPITGSPPLGATSHCMLTAAIQYSRVGAVRAGGPQAGDGEQGDQGRQDGQLGVGARVS